MLDYNDVNAWVRLAHPNKMRLPCCTYHYDESSECATARQQKLAEVAYNRIREDTDGVNQPLRRGGGSS